MKTLKVTAWIGLGFMTVGVIISFFILWELVLFPLDLNPNPGYYPEAGWVLIYPIDFLGILFMYIGGLKARPKYLSLASLAVGVLHIGFSIPPEWRFLVRQIHENGLEGTLFWISFIWPGLLAILLAILLLIMNKRSRKTAEGYVVIS